MEDSRQRVVIIGGGNVAIDVARTILRLRSGQADNIKIVCPESRDEMPALTEEVREASEEGIRIMNKWAPYEIVREKDMQLSFYRAQVMRDKATGQIDVVRMGQETMTLPVEKIILAIGQAIDEENILQDLDRSHGMIRIGPDGMTSLSKVFAGGDAVGEKPYVANAIASGKKGALAIDCYLQGRNLEAIFGAIQIANSHTFSFGNAFSILKKPPIDLRSIVTLEQINTLFFSRKERQNPPKQNAAQRTKTFEEVTEGMDAEKTKEELGRCFRCGTCTDCKNCVDFCPDVCISQNQETGLYISDDQYCKGCGVCAVACPRHIVEMRGERV